MLAQEIYEKLKAEFGDAIIEFKQEPFFDPFVQVNPEKLFDICLYLRDTPDLDFDYLSLLGGMDYKENLGVVYHLYSVKLKHSFVLKVTLSKDNPVVSSVVLMTGKVFH
ncbi:MAG: NADH-quinone oxidoreductase subunit C [Ignavibacteriae bacterium]|nr:NADH-quinone oxidoreductase subunit C [Ignavibacteriota bacterium]